VTIAAGIYSPNGQDYSWLNAGDKVTVFTPGAWSARVNLEILSVVGTTITFTASHLAAPGDVIRTDDFNTVVANQKGFAFLADDDGVLGVDTPGFVIA
jgi:hypothetical protein